MIYLVVEEKNFKNVSEADRELFIYTNGSYAVLAIEKEWDYFFTLNSEMGYFIPTNQDLYLDNFKQEINPDYLYNWKNEKLIGTYKTLETCNASYNIFGRPSLMQVFQTLEEAKACVKKRQFSDEVTYAMHD